MKKESTQKRMDRRAAIKWLLAASATVHLLDGKSFAQGQDPLSKGYGTGPKMLTGEVPWDRTLTPEQLRTTSKLADIILPRTSETSPSATEVNVPDFIDEWISAPYEAQQEDRTVILDGLAWIDRESQRRFGKDFHELEEAQYTPICDDICFAPEALPEYRHGARFFSSFRSKGSMVSSSSSTISSCIIAAPVPYT